MAEIKENPAPESEKDKVPATPAHAPTPEDEAHLNETRRIITRLFMQDFIRHSGSKTDPWDYDPEDAP